MKTKTLNNQAIIYTIKKLFSLILFSILILGSEFSFAQTSTYIDVNNLNLNSGCDWVVTVKDNSSTIIDGPTTVVAGSRYQNCITGQACTVEVIDVGATCNLITFGNLCLFPYTSVSPTCTPGSCSPSIDCSGNSGINCTSPNTYVLIQIH